jgi:hypothetical protein
MFKIQEYDDIMRASEMLKPAVLFPEKYDFCPAAVAAGAGKAWWKPERHHGRL